MANLSELVKTMFQKDLSALRELVNKSYGDKLNADGIFMVSEVSKDWRNLKNVTFSKRSASLVAIALKQDYHAASFLTKF